MSHNLIMLIFNIIIIVLLFVVIKVYIKFVYRLFEIAREILDRMFDRE